jgi:glycosyltransferase involved in cell wall biosynthesis
MPGSSVLHILHFAHVFPRYSGDSIAPFLLSYARGLRRAGVECSALVPHAPGLSLQEEVEGFSVIRFRQGPDAWERLAYRGMMHELVLKSLSNKLLFLLFLVSAFVSLLLHVRRLRPRAVHVHWWIPCGIAAWACSFFSRVPYVLTTHGTDVFLVSRFGFLRPLARLVFGRAAKVTVVSSYLKELVVEQLGLPSEKVEVISMPVDEELHRPSPVRPLETSPLQILTVGRLIERKGARYLIEAVSQLPPSLEWHLTIVGEGPWRDQLRELAVELGTEEQLTWVEAMAPAELPALYRKAGIFVLPSITDWKGEKEGLGVVLLEAALGGARLIACRSGGMEDIVKHEETGLLVPEKDAGAIRDALVRFSQDPDLARRCAEGALRLYEERFRSSRAAEKTVSVYDALPSQ